MAAEIGWYPDPYDASRLRWWDGSQWTEHAAPAVPTSTPEAQPWGGPGQDPGWNAWTRPALQPISGPATAVQVLLVGWLIHGTATIVSRLVERGLLTDVRDDPVSVAFADLQASDDRIAALDMISLVLLAATAVVFLLWMNRAYKNLQAFGATTLRRSTGWSVGGWFIPFANLVIPYQSMRDTWVGSAPDRTDYPFQWWGLGAPASVVGWWWALWLASGVAGQVAAFSVPAVDADLDAYFASNALIIAAEVVALASAVAALVLVRRLTARQQQRATALAGTI